MRPGNIGMEELRAEEQRTGEHRDGETSGGPPEIDKINKERERDERKGKKQRKR